MARYEALKDPMVARKQKLADSLRLQQLFRDIEDEETWIREKEPIAASTNRGWSLLGSLGSGCQSWPTLGCSSVEVSAVLTVVNAAWRATPATSRGSSAAGFLLHSWQ